MKLTRACDNLSAYVYVRSRDARTDRVGVDPCDRARLVRR